MAFSFILLEWQKNKKILKKYLTTIYNVVYNKDEVNPQRQNYILN